MSSPPKPRKPPKALKPQKSALDVVSQWSTSKDHVASLKQFINGLEVFYSARCPDKIPGIPHAVNRIYQNDEITLVKDLCLKYEVNETSSEYLQLLSYATLVRDAYHNFKSSYSTGEDVLDIDKNEKISADNCNYASSDSSIKSSAPLEKSEHSFSGPFTHTQKQNNACSYFTDAEYMKPNTEVSLPTSRPLPPPPPRQTLKDPSALPGTEKVKGESEVDADSENYRLSVHNFQPPENDAVIREGNMTKLRSKDGFEETHYFILRNSCLTYIKKQSGQVGKRAINNAQLLLSSMTGYAFGTDKLEEELTRTISLEDVLVLPLAKGDRGGSGAGTSVGLNKLRASITSTNVMADVPDDKRTFRLFTRQKSFFLRSESKMDRDAWFDAIDSAATAVQMKSLNRRISQTEVCPIRVFADTVTECQVCTSAFGLMNRRHHCRACGACVCESCSREKVRIPSLDPRALFKCCNLCASELKAARRYGSNRSSDL